MDIKAKYGYERVYLPLYIVADTAFHIKGDEMFLKSLVRHSHGSV